jgi:hypothetical protein
LHRLRELVMKSGNEPDDTLLLSRAKRLVWHAAQVSQSMQGEQVVDSIRQQLHRLDRQAAVLGSVTAYTHTVQIPKYLDLLAEAEPAADTANVLIMGLQVEIARHTKITLIHITRQLERRLPHSSRLIPVVRLAPDHVREGESYRVEVFPLEVFVFSPEWRPTLYADGKAISLRDGAGAVRFKVTGPPGKKTWEGGLAFRPPGGGDTMIRKQFHYVALPE